MAEYTNQKVTEPVAPRGERVAEFVETYLKDHPGLSQGELAFRIRADKRDVQRLLRDRSVGHRLEEALAAYFGDWFVETIFRPVIGDCPSQRERELERERADIAARRGLLERQRAEHRAFRVGPPDLLRVVPEQDGRADV
jgi:hypothetical protein